MKSFGTLAILLLLSCRLTARPFLQRSFITSHSRLDSQGDGSNTAYEQLALPLQALEDRRELQYHGTTTLAFIHKSSLFVCVDSKASLGSYVGSKTVQKLIPITPTIVATMAGGAADCFFFIRQISAFLKRWEFDYGTTVPVSGIAKVLSTSLRQYRGQGLSIGTMIAGFDDIDGASLYYVDSEGTCLPGNLFCVGSGSILAYSILDSKVEDRIVGLSHLSRDQAIGLAVNAVRHATLRDGYSGGYVNLFEVNETGIFHLQANECQKFLN